jgi:hypothetical protein
MDKAIRDYLEGIRVAEPPSVVLDPRRQSARALFYYVAYTQV